MSPHHQSILGAIAWLAPAHPSALCPIQRLRYWAGSTVRYEEEQLRHDLTWLEAAGFVRWYMPGVLTLTTPGARIGRSVLERCMA